MNAFVFLVPALTNHLAAWSRGPKETIVASLHLDPAVRAEMDIVDRRLKRIAGE